MKRIITFFSLLLIAVISASALSVYDGEPKPPSRDTEPGSAPPKGSNDVPILTFDSFPKPKTGPTTPGDYDYYALDDMGSMLDVVCSVSTFSTTLSFCYEDGTRILDIEIINRNTGESRMVFGRLDGSASTEVFDCQGKWSIVITTVTGQTRTGSVLIY